MNFSTRFYHIIVDRSRIYIFEVLFFFFVIKVILNNYINTRFINNTVDLFNSSETRQRAPSNCGVKII